MAGINWALIAPIIVIQLILMVTALVDLGRSEETNGPKILWVFVILLISMIGPILYFVIGRKR
ncbi:PLDc N-terminal domain-containing protein [Bacillus timonensis]|uniref:PLDc N-terminal domain-containing protein n=1 Tax=Bacillus timonensis TaxID=1033734 RepID=UPI0002894786|nr:PLD nuclease N-terminal domain-containing protein [Bacillus timonensis]